MAASWPKHGCGTSSPPGYSLDRIGLCASSSDNRQGVSSNANTAPVPASSVSLNHICHIAQSPGEGKPWIFIFTCMSISSRTTTIKCSSSIYSGCGVGAKDAGEVLYLRRCESKSMGGRLDPYAASRALSQRRPTSETEFNSYSFYHNAFGIWPLCTVSMLP